MIVNDDDDYDEQTRTNIMPLSGMWNASLLVIYMTLFT
jgi:hypothetical protein